MLLSTYLIFNGNCRDAFEFYRSVFGGEFTVLQTFAEGPEDMPIPDEMKDQIMHVSLPVGGSILMGSDNATGEKHTIGNNFSITVNPDSREECEQLFVSISIEGEVTMPLQETFWGAYYGHCRDRFGVNWMFNFAL